MTSTQEDSKTSSQEDSKDLKRIIGVLSSTANLAESASLKGSFRGGERRCIVQYNAVLDRLREIDAAPEGLFQPLPSEASFGAIGIACMQLAAYLKDDLNLVSLLETTARLAERATLRGSHKGGATWCIPQYNALLHWLEGIDAIPARLFPPLDDDASFSEAGIAYSQLAAYLKNGDNGESDDPLQKLQNLGELIRQAMPDFLRKEKSESSTLVVEVEEEKVSETESSPLVDSEEKHFDLSREDAERQISELGEQIQGIAAQLQQAELPSEERERLTEAMQTVARQQAEFVRRYALIRSAG